MNIPPLGCKPYFITIAHRASELADAIKRYTDQSSLTTHDMKLIGLWGKELYYLSKIMENLEQDFYDTQRTN